MRQRKSSGRGIVGRFLGVTVLVTFVGCGGGVSSGPSGGGDTGGGVASSGGASAGGGSGSTGGRSGTGGRGGTSPGTGGASATTTGGATASGGSTATATGGRSPSGGVAGTGGGVSASGGNRGTGGAIASGGVSGTGGGVASGGNTGGGACVQSTCGSHKWACWKMPNPASSPAAVPNHQSHTDLGNGTVRDNITCLTWEKANPAAQGTWQASADRCAALASSNYAGFGDWRLPTRVEMASITDVTLGSKGFPPIFTVTSGYYDTASWWYETITGQSTSNFHFGYGTNGFTSNAVSMTNTNNVARCVRGNGAGEAPNAFAKEPPNHYTVAGAPPNGEVTDNYTGLTWQQGFSPAAMAWTEAPAYCAGLNLNGHAGWRVSTLNELASTVNEALVGGAINRTAFPGNPTGCGPTFWFWAAEASKIGGTAWGLSYCDGFTGWNAGASGGWNNFPTARVRCVR